MVLIKKMYLEPSKSCSLEIPKGAKIINMEARAGQIQIYLIFEESAPMEKRCFCVARDDDVIYKEMNKLLYIGSSISNKSWDDSVHLFEVLS